MRCDDTTAPLDAIRAPPLVSLSDTKQRLLHFIPKTPGNSYPDGSFPKSHPFLTPKFGRTSICISISQYQSVSVG